MSEATATSTSHPELTGATSMSEVLSAFPGARRALFARYHIGGCQSCGFQDEETLGEVCERNEELPVGEVIDHILSSHEEDEKILLDPAALAESIGDGGETPKLLDVRTREEFEAVKLPGAELFSNDLMNEVFGSWEKETPIVVYDHTGDRSLDAAAYLLGHGFKNTRALRGGIDAYSREADPDLPRYRVELE